MAGREGLTPEPPLTASDRSQCGHAAPRPMATHKLIYAALYCKKAVWPAGRRHLVAFNYSDHPSVEGLRSDEQRRCLRFVWRRRPRAAVPVT